jgi:hypothetical protein
MNLYKRQEAKVAKGFGTKSQLFSALGVLGVLAVEFSLSLHSGRLRRKRAASRGSKLASVRAIVHYYYRLLLLSGVNGDAPRASEWHRRPDGTRAGY